MHTPVNTVVRTDVRTSCNTALPAGLERSLLLQATCIFDTDFVKFVFFVGDTSELYDNVLSQHLLPHVRKADSRDPWVEHIALWLLRKPKDAVKCLLVR